MNRKDLLNKIRKYHGIVIDLSCDNSDDLILSELCSDLDSDEENNFRWYSNKQLVNLLEYIKDVLKDYEVVENDI